MLSKFKKFADVLKIVTEKPYLLNHLLNDNLVWKERHLNQYPNFYFLPQITLDQLCDGEVRSKLQSFLLDGSSMITDLALLKILAKNKENYFEIGTWRGESVWNVAEEIQDCTTMNLSTKEMLHLGLNENYADLHGVLSKENSAIQHLEGNSRTFDFSSLQKKYDLIFIDGDHSYAMVKNDTEKVFQHLVHENSVVVWHDYAYNPEKIRYEVFKAILDGMPKSMHQHVYHVANTMCSVFIRKDVKTNNFESPKNPEFLFNIKLDLESFTNKKL